MDMTGLTVNLIVMLGMLTSVVGSPSVTVIGKFLLRHYFVWNNVVWNYVTSVKMLTC